VQLPVSGVFLYLQGNRPATDFLQGQLDVKSNGCLRVDEQHATSIPGVFAVGDILHTHVRQAVVAAAEGVTAAISVKRSLIRHDPPRQDWG
jgi:thioredoxin reductase (NADPH)